ncbi:MAG: hypothetical protein EOO75_21265, partial [Myxococcales bacterium]
MNAPPPTPPRPGPSADDERLLQVLGRYVSRITATGLLENARREPEVAALAGTEEGFARLADRLALGVKLFTDEATRARVRQDLAMMRGAPIRPVGSSVRQPAPAPARAEIGDRTTRLDIRTEADLAEARAVARDLCVRLSARSLVLQRVATIVGELARNMLSYAGGGQLTIGFRTAPRPLITIRAADTG